MINKMKIKPTEQDKIFTSNMTDKRLMSEHLSSQHWEDPEESGREGGGRGDQDGEYM